MPPAPHLLVVYAQNIGQKPRNLRNIAVSCALTTIVYNKLLATPQGLKIAQNVTSIVALKMFNSEIHFE